ncbi:MAG: M48 family metallopeptidase, partial [Desulfobacca sp.]|uniref:M48 family metallopeptidase n=1 Tax=Desulfobacca sp. TaxID=2067990 RepID=UPI0040494D01
LYPLYLPAEYGFLMVSGQSGSAYNAYTAPGMIMISRKMLEFCRSDDELAIILGHELAHQAHGHRLRREVRLLLANLVPEIIALPFRLFWSGSDWYYGVDKDLRRLVGNASISVFSRQDEREADAYGLWYAFQAGYDVDQGIYIWERLAAVVHHNVFETTYYLDSHPVTAERLARLKKMARLFQEGKAAQVLVP